MTEIIVKSNPVFDSLKHAALMTLIEHGESRSQERIELAALCALVEMKRSLMNPPLNQPLSKDAR
jgi:hypothetical protein